MSRITHWKVQLVILQESIRVEGEWIWINVFVVKHDPEMHFSLERMKEETITNNQKFIMTIEPAGIQYPLYSPPAIS